MARHEASGDDQAGNEFARWDPALYTRFADERARPFRDLLAVVDVPWATSVLDLGCGPGTMTAQLAARWPAARVVGVDSSADMLAAARALEVPGHLEFVLADLRAYEPDEPVDVVVTNATLQWVPGHLELLGRLASFLAPGGVLALQVPGNFNEPSHVLLHALAETDRWRPLLEGKLADWPSSHDTADYLDALAAAGLATTAWETTYFQVLSGDDAVLEWMKGTGLRPVLAALPAGEADEFLASYGASLCDPYPPRPGGTVLPYRRVFAVGTRGVPEAARGVVCGLDHAQVAMPAGGEDGARAFYRGVLGLAEEPKPPALATRGGCWFAGPGTTVHIGVDPDFRPARKAHVGLAVEGLDALARRLEAAGRPVRWDDTLAPSRRLYTEDPFGNRVELLERAR